MRYSYAAGTSTNLLTLNDEGTHFAAAHGSKVLVGTKDLSLQKLQSCWKDFQLELRQALVEAYSRTPAEFAFWHVHNDAYVFDNSIVGADSCIGFKRMAAGGPKLHYLRQPQVVEALVDLKMVPETGTRGQRRKSIPRGEGGVAPFCQSLTLDEQRRVISLIFSDPHVSLDDIVFINQTSIIDTEEVEELLHEADCAETAFKSLAEKLSEFDLEQQTGTSGGRGAGRHFAAPWFCMYLAREGYVLLPRLKAKDKTGGSAVGR